MSKHIAEGILYLNEAEVRQAYAEIDSIGLIRELFALHGCQETILPDEAYLGWTNGLGENVRSLNMPGYIGGTLRVAGTKIINGNIANPTRGLPRASGLFLLFDDLSARIQCIMEGASISGLRTASVTLLAAEVLRGRPIQDVALIGSGVLSQAHIELLLKRRDLFPAVRCIHLFDLQPERVQELMQRQLANLNAHGIDLRITRSAEEAVRAAQLIIPVTTTTSGYIAFDWLQPGALLVNVSLDDALPDVVQKADKVIVDDWNLVKNDPRRLIGRMYRAGEVVGPDDAEPAAHEQVRRIDAQLGEIIAGKKEGRRHDDEIILMNPFGLAIEDVMLANSVYKVALETGLGLLLER